MEVDVDVSGEELVDLQVPSARDVALLKIAGIAEVRVAEHQRVARAVGLVRTATEDAVRLCAHERVAGQPLAALDALQKK